MENKYTDAARLFKALADESRIRILELLVGGEKFAGKLLEDVDVTQPTLSHHLKILCDAGLVNVRKDGRWMYYSISVLGMDKLFDTLMNFAVPTEQKNAVLEKKRSIKKAQKDIVIL